MLLPSLITVSLRICYKTRWRLNGKRISMTFSWPELNEINNTVLRENNSPPPTPPLYLHRQCMKERNGVQRAYWDRRVGMGFSIQTANQFRIYSSILILELECLPVTFRMFTSSACATWMKAIRQTCDELQNTTACANSSCNLSSSSGRSRYFTAMWCLLWPQVSCGHSTVDNIRL